MAAGDLLVMTNTTDTSSLAEVGADNLLTYNNEVKNVGSMSYAAGVFTLGETGRYLVMVSEQYATTDTTTNERNNGELTLHLGGAELNEGKGSGYIRRTGGSQGYINFAAAIIEVTSTTGDADELEAHLVLSDSSTTGTVDRVADRSGIHILKLDDTWGYGRYESSAGITTSTTDNTRTEINLQTEVEEDSPFTRTTNTIDIATSNLVLAVYTVYNSTDMGSATREEYQACLELAGVELDGTWTQQMLRGADDCKGGMSSCVFLLDPTSGDDLKLILVNREAGGREEWRGTLQLVELPAAAKAAIVTTTTSTNVNAAATALTLAATTADYIDTDVFSYSGPDTKIDYDVADDFLVMGGWSISSDAGVSSGTQRQVPALQFASDGGALDVIGASSFHRETGTVDHASAHVAGLATDEAATGYVALYADTIGTTATLTSEEVGLAVIQLSSLFPSGTDIVSEPGIDDLVLAGKVPTIAVTAHHVIESAIDDLVLAGQAPTVVVTDHVDALPAIDDLVLAGQAPTIAVTANWVVPPAIDDLALAGQVPTVIAGASHVITVAQDALVLAGQAPTIAVTANHVALPAIDDLALAGQAPTIAVTANHVAPPAIDALAITGKAPTAVVTANHVALPAAETLALSGEIPITVTVALVFVVPVGTLTLTTFKGLRLFGYPPIPTVNETVAPTVDTLALAGQAPTALVSQDAEEPAAATLTIAGQVPTVQQTLSATPAAATLALAGQLPLTIVPITAEPGGEGLTLNGVAPVVTSQGTNPTFIPAVGSLTLTTFKGLQLFGYPPTLVSDIAARVLTPAAETLALTGQAPATLIPGSIVPAAATLTLAGQVPSSFGPVEAAPAIDALSLGGIPPTISIAGASPIFTPQAYALSFVTYRGLQLFGYAPTVVTSSGMIVPAAATLALTPQSPQAVILGSPVFVPGVYEMRIVKYRGLQLFGYAPTISTPLAGEHTVKPAQAPLTFNGKTPVRGVGLQLKGYAPNLVETDAKPAAAALTLIGHAPIVSPSLPPDVIPTFQRLLLAEGSNLALARGQETEDSSLALLGYAPLAEASSPIFYPPVLPLVLDGKSIGDNPDVLPDEATLTLAGQLPLAVGSLVITPAVGTLTIVEGTPEYFANTTLVSPPGTTLTISNESVYIGRSIWSAAIARKLNGKVPLVVSTDVDFTPEVAKAALALTGAAPLVVMGQGWFAPAAGSLTITGKTNVPGVETESLKIPSAARPMLTTFAPSLGGQTIGVPVGAQLTLSGQAVSLITKNVTRDGARLRLVRLTVRRSIEMLYR